jgi:small subunit ribosomal protein S20
VKLLANIKSSIKRIRITEAKTLRNKMVKSTVKTSIRKFEENLAAGNIDKAAAKGVMHPNTAARNKSRLALKMNRAAAQ